MITVSVVMPTVFAKFGAKSLFDLETFYYEKGNEFAAKVCEAAITCKARSFKVAHRVKDPARGKSEFKRVHFVVLTLDFETAADGGKFIKLYGDAIT